MEIVKLYANGSLLLMNVEPGEKQGHLTFSLPSVGRKLANIPDSETGDLRERMIPLLGKRVMVHTQEYATSAELKP